MTQTRLSNDALDILRDEPARVQSLYVYLARHCDYKTGVTGARRRVSYQSMIEWLSVPAVPGRAAEKISKPTIQTLLKRLAKIGVITDMGQCVFLLKHHTPDYSASTRLIRGQYGVNTSDNLQATDNNEVFKDDDHSFSRFKSEVPTPLYQSINLTRARAKFEMSYSWVPSADFLDLARCSMLDVSVDGEHREMMMSALGEFRLYWMGREPIKHRNQQEWERSFLQKLIRQKSQPSLNSGGYTNAVPGKRKSGGRQLSAAERNAEQARQWQQEQ